MFSMFLLAAFAASTDLCNAAVLSAVVKDNDLAEPFTLVTTDGKTYRLLGQDFIHPRDWNSGDELQVCAQPGPGRLAKITDIKRSEQLIGELVRHGGEAHVHRP